MVHEHENYAYCSSCSKNVPHHRGTSGIASNLSEGLLLTILDKLKIGPWYCLHCERKSLIRPGVRKDRANYQIIDPLAPAAAHSDVTWVRASVAEQAEAPDGESEVTEATCCEGRENDAGDSVVDDEVSEFRDGFDAGFLPETERITAESWQSAKKPDPVVAQQHFSEDIVGASDGQTDATSDSIATLDTPQADDDMARHKNSSMAAEPIGNFIKDRSLILRSTRMHRVSAKFRDSIVKRILSGNLSISQLTSNGEYTEGELISWIADRMNRLNQKIEILEEQLDEL